MAEFEMLFAVQGKMLGSNPGEACAVVLNQRVLRVEMVFGAHTLDGLSRERV